MWMYIGVFGWKCQCSGYLSSSCICARPGAGPSSSALCLELHSATPFATPFDIIPYNCNMKYPLFLNAMSNIFHSCGRGGIPSPSHCVHQELRVHAARRIWTTRSMQVAPSCWNCQWPVDSKTHHVEAYYPGRPTRTGNFFLQKLILTMRFLGPGG